MSESPSPQIPDNAPWWSKAIEMVIHTGGISLLLVMFRIAQQAGWVPNPVEQRLVDLENSQTKILEGLQQNAGGTIRHDATMQELIKAVQDQARQMEEGEKRRQMWCVIRAKTDDEKKACFPSAPK